MGCNGSLPHWVEIELIEKLAIDKFRWYTGQVAINQRDHIVRFKDGELINIYEDESPNINN